MCDIPNAWISTRLQANILSKMAQNENKVALQAKSCWFFFVFVFLKKAFRYTQTEMFVCGTI